MTYQEKFAELQNRFSEKFDIYEKFQKELSPGKEESEEFLTAKAEFEKVSYEFQNFLMVFKDNNASSNDELGTMGQRCE